MLFSDGFLDTLIPFSTVKSLRNSNKEETGQMTLRDQCYLVMITPEQPEAFNRHFKSTSQNKMHIKL